MKLSMPSIGKKRNLDRLNNRGARRLSGILIVLALQACSMLPLGEAPTPLPPTSAVSIPDATSTSPATPTALPPTQTQEEAATQPVPSATPEPPTAIPPSVAVPANALPDPAAYTWKLVADGLDKPIGIATAGDGSDRLFIIEQRGRIRILKRRRPES